MTFSPTDALPNLEIDHPEWQPWLAVLRETISEANRPVWDVLVPEPTYPQQPKIPLLARHKLEVSESHLRRWRKTLMATAAKRGAENMTALDAVSERRWDVSSLFRASLCHDVGALDAMADDLGLERAAFDAIALLFAVPFSQACNRKWKDSVAPGWTEGYCPICGAWPVFAEVRGIERGRYLRCGRCAGAWEAPCVRCPFCGMTDHDHLGSLVPERSETVGVVEVCKRCLGYIKSFTLLQGTPAERVMLLDLGSVALDVAALNENYKRPDGLGYALQIDITLTATFAERMLPWRS